MSMTVEIPARLERQIRDLASRSNRPIHAVVDEALERYLAAGPADPSSDADTDADWLEAFERARGMWLDHQNPPDAQALRQSWQRVNDESAA